VSIRLKVCACAIALVLGLCPHGARADEVLTNQDVIDLIKAGINTDLVRRKVETSDNSFDVTAEAMVKLREQEVPDEIIGAMLTAAEEQAARHRSRIMLQIQMLTSDRPEARQAAYLRLLRAGRPARERMLELLVSSPSPEIRAAVAGALARMEESEAVPILRVLLDDTRPLVRRAAADALFELKGKEAAENARERIRDAVARGYARPVDAYVRLLGHAQDKQAVGLLEDLLLESPHASVRAEAAWALAQLESEQSRPLLEIALRSDGSREVRTHAVAALGRFADPRSLPELIRAANRDRVDGTVLFRALGRYPATEVVPVLVTCIREDLSEEEQDVLIGVLRKLTRQDFGMDRSRWLKWWELNEAKIRAGGWGDVLPAEEGTAPAEEPEEQERPAPPEPEDLPAPTGPEL